MDIIIFKRLNHKLIQSIALVVIALDANQAQAVNYTFSDLGSITGSYAGDNAVANGINNLGQVVGNNSLNALVWNGNTATQLGNLPGQVAAYQGMSINDSGQIAGYNRNIGGIEFNNAIRWDGTTATQLDGGELSWGFGINKHGQVAGMNWITLSTHSVRWDGTTLTDLEPSGGTSWSQAWAINDAGQAVGNSDVNAGEAYHAMLYSGGTITDLGTLGGTISDAHSINDVGQIVGWSDITDDLARHAVLWNGATLTNLAALGGNETFSTAEDINNLGQIVGYSEIISGSSHATLWEGSSLVDLNNYLPTDLAAAGWVLTQAKGINDSGVIVGWAQNGTDPNTALFGAFKLTPTAVPLPGAVWLFSSALAGLMGVSRHKIFAI
jgi:probable HAF family extracellular repeat protein